MAPSRADDIERCRHCGNIGAWEDRCSASDPAPVQEDSEPWETLYQFRACKNCKKITILCGPWAASMEAEDWHPDVFHPPVAKRLQGLPASIDQEYRAANAVSTISPNAYAVLLGRVLELLCMDRGAQGNTLYEQLNYLAGRGEIPTHLAQLAQQLRDLRNVGAHAGLGSLTPEEIPVLESLCRAVLEYVYEAPRLVAEVDQRIKKLKAAKPKKTASPAPPTSKD